LRIGILLEPVSEPKAYAVHAMFANGKTAYARQNIEPIESIESIGEASGRLFMSGRLLGGHSSSIASTVEAQ
jgi:hypothetical protein